MICMAPVNSATSVLLSFVPSAAVDLSVLCRPGKIFRCIFSVESVSNKSACIGHYAIVLGLSWKEGNRNKLLHGSAFN